MPPLPKGQPYRLAAGQWGIRFYDHDGVRRRKSPFPSRSAALAYYEDTLQPATPDEQAQIREWVRRCRKPVDPRSWVYVMVAPELRRIKIGRTKDPDRRLRDCRTASPSPLNTLLMVPGAGALEAKLLDVTTRFAVNGCGSEWRRIEALEVVFALIRERSNGASW